MNKQQRKLFVIPKQGAKPPPRNEAWQEVRAFVQGTATELFEDLKAYPVRNSTVLAVAAMGIGFAFWGKNKIEHSEQVGDMIEGATTGVQQSWRYAEGHPVYVPTPGESPRYTNLMRSIFDSTDDATLLKGGDRYIVNAPAPRESVDVQPTAPMGASGREKDPLSK